MIKIYEVRQVVNSLPKHRSVVRPALVNLCQLRASRMHGGQLHGPISVGCAVTVDARLCRWDGCVSRFFHRCVAVTAIHLQLARVQFMTEGNWLFWRIAQVRGFRRCAGHEDHGTIRSDGGSADEQQFDESIDPRWKLKIVHEFMFA